MALGGGEQGSRRPAPASILPPQRLWGTGRAGAGGLPATEGIRAQLRVPSPAPGVGCGGSASRHPGGQAASWAAVRQRHPGCAWVPVPTAVPQRRGTAHVSALGTGALLPRSCPGLRCSRPASPPGWAPLQPKQGRSSDPLRVGSGSRSRVSLSQLR